MSSRKLSLRPGISLVTGVVVTFGGAFALSACQRDQEAKGERPQQVVIVPNIREIPPVDWSEREEPAAVLAEVSGAVGESAAGIRVVPEEPVPSAPKSGALPAPVQEQAAASVPPPAPAAAAPPQPAPETARRPEEPPPAEPATEQVPKTGSPMRLELTATARQVWVWVSADGGPVRAVSLEKGESAAFTAEQGYKLTVDDAGGIEATLDGKQLPSLGEPSRARRNVAIPSPEMSPVG